MFEDEDVSELTTNVIDKSMYAMSHENSDHILLFDSIVHNGEMYNAMTKGDQRFIESRGKPQ